MPTVKGAEIRRSRQQLGIKLGQFAEQAGVGYKTLANIECGHQRTVSIENVVRIARALGIENAEDLIADGNAEPEGTVAAAVPGRTK